MLLRLMVEEGVVVVVVVKGRIVGVLGSVFGGFSSTPFGK